MSAEIHNRILIERVVAEEGGGGGRVVAEEGGGGGNHKTIFYWLYPNQL